MRVAELIKQDWPKVLTVKNSTLYWVQVTTGLGFFLHSIVKVWIKLIVLTPCPQAYSLLTGPYWDSVYDHDTTL